MAESKEHAADAPHASTRYHSLFYVMRPALQYRNRAKHPLAGTQETHPAAERTGRARFIRQIMNSMANDPSPKEILVNSFRMQWIRAIMGKDGKRMERWRDWTEFRDDRFLRASTCAREDRQSLRHEKRCIAIREKIGRDFLKGTTSLQDQMAVEPRFARTHYVPSRLFLRTYFKNAIF